MAAKKYTADYTLPLMFMIAFMVCCYSLVIFSDLFEPSNLTRTILELDTDKLNDIKLAQWSTAIMGILTVLSLSYEQFKEWRV